MTTPSPTEADASRPARRSQVIAAFLTIYLVWGSTYLAIRFAVETLPPFLMAGARFGIAGIILYAISRRRGAPRPTASQWLSAVWIGGLLLLGGNGAVVSVAHLIPSGLSALMVATVTFWMVGLDWLVGSGARPSGRIVIGLATGFVGLAILLGPGKFAGAEGSHVLGALVILGGAFSWAAGSILARRSRLTGDALLDTALKQVAGGALLCVAGLARGELGTFDLTAVSGRSAGAFVYLLILGSLISFTAYVWLLRVSTPARISTYAYVNPVIAVFLGWLVAGEQPTLGTLVGSVVILAAVVVVTTARDPAEKVPEPVPVDLEPVPDPVAGEVDGASSSAAPLEGR